MPQIYIVGHGVRLDRRALIGPGTAISSPVPHGEKLNASQIISVLEGTDSELKPLNGPRLVPDYHISPPPDDAELQWMLSLKNLRCSGEVLIASVDFTSTALCTSPSKCGKDGSFNHKCNGLLRELRDAYPDSLLDIHLLICRGNAEPSNVGAGANQVARDAFQAWLLRRSFRERAAFWESLTDRDRLAHLSQAEWRRFSSLYGIYRSSMDSDSRFEGYRSYLSLQRAGRSDDYREQVRAELGTLEEAWAADFIFAQARFRTWIRRVPAQARARADFIDDWNASSASDRRVIAAIDSGFFRSTLARVFGDALTRCEALEAPESVEVRSRKYGVLEQPRRLDLETALADANARLNGSHSDQMCFVGAVKVPSHVFFFTEGDGKPCDAWRDLTTADLLSKRPEARDGYAYWPLRARTVYVGDVNHFTPVKLESGEAKLCADLDQSWILLPDRCISEHYYSPDEENVHATAWGTFAHPVPPMETAGAGEPGTWHFQSVHTPGVPGIMTVVRNGDRYDLTSNSGDSGYAVHDERQVLAGCATLSKIVVSTTGMGLGSALMYCVSVNGQHDGSVSATAVPPDALGFFTRLGFAHPAHFSQDVETKYHEYLENLQEGDEVVALAEYLAIAERTANLYANRTELACHAWASLSKSWRLIDEQYLSEMVSRVSHQAATLLDSYANAYQNYRKSSFVGQLAKRKARSQVGPHYAAFCREAAGTSSVLAYLAEHGSPAAAVVLPVITDITNGVRAKLTGTLF
ncbi:hypothetical protein ACTVZO_39275 [Streptomyces sp. IBSNAI002]|uniref:hypothetical protein n=1 Tax=Streptomyces sp. IBSNAI002 TaxID=3457500 RepID=UPI003FD2D809